MYKRPKYAVRDGCKKLKWTHVLLCACSTEPKLDMKLLVSDERLLLNEPK